MKKFLLSLMCLCALGAHADEGMWTLYNLPEAVYQQMQQYGFQLSKEQLYQTDNAVKNAVVNFSGYCSGVVVSPDGLVFTNHHCGFDAIRRHSTVEHDYMLNGFIATRFTELPTMIVTLGTQIIFRGIAEVLFETWGNGGGTAPDRRRRSGGGSPCRDRR